MNPEGQIAQAKARLDGMTALVAEPAQVKDVLIYKLLGKMVAILSMRADASVSLKCDPVLAEMLREQYVGVGHRYHLDRRHWINVTLNADVPDDDLERLIGQSYDLVKAGLSRVQRTSLEATKIS